MKKPKSREIGKSQIAARTVKHSNFYNKGSLKPALKFNYKRTEESEREMHFGNGENPV